MRRVIIDREFGGHRVPVGTEGFFHQWGSESNEDAGPDTVAVIEKDDGSVICAYPGQIRFLEPYATAAKLAATPAGIARACGMENEVERAAEVSATNPPKGWRLAKHGEPRKFGYIFWMEDETGWCMGYQDRVGWLVDEAIGADIIANPIEVAP
ncbi:MAG: hypothetical protein IPO40_24850 [Fibrobacteres bacterium]|nr:hypothetical protein [Fibrobacterota bacterium]